MKVILLQNIKKIGQKDEVKDVNEGHARNLLIPRKLAVEATPKALGELKKRQEEKSVKKEKTDKEFLSAVNKLSGFDLVIKKKANPEGHLFSSVSLKEIVQRLSEEGIGLRESDLDLSDHIKSLGKHGIKVKNSEATLQVIIEKE